MPDAPTIGILALQGSVREHQRAIRRCGAVPALVKQAEEIALLDGLIIPGGESTTIAKLMSQAGLTETIKQAAEEGLAIFGTCAGLILMAREIARGEQGLLGLVDIKARRNAYGSQAESFEADIAFDSLSSKKYRAIFIRAPLVEATGSSVTVLASYQGKPVLLEERQFLVSCFHPELTDDLEIHRHFLKMIEKNKGQVKQRGG